MTYWEDVSEEATTTDKQAANKRKIADAAGQVRVAQAKLDEIRNKENATDSQRLAAEEKLAAAQRRLAAAEHDAAATSDNDTPDDKPGKPSAASQLVELALERYGFGVTEDGQPYAVQPGRHVVRMLRGGKNSLRAELSKEFYKQHEKVPAQQALADALLVLEGMAQDQDPDQVHLRVAQANGSVWYDLCDAAETVIKIDPTGWQIVRDGVPVLFRRTELTGIMSEPDHGGDIELLWDHLNVSASDRPLVLAWLIAAVIDPEAPHAILSLFGEHGTGKSTASKRIVMAVDPSSVPLRKPPRDPESWVTAAQGSWAVGLDNLSTVPDWLSDSLCRAATGDGDVRRALYTDGQLAVFAFRRCILLNGIDVGALRGDLADRIVKIDLDRIADDARQEEKELNAQWAADYPMILGGLLSLAAETMARLPSVRLDKKPRMADFARILAAIDQLLGTDGLSRYIEQALTMAEDSLTSDPFLARMHEIKVDITGKASELLAKVTPDLDGWRPPKAWPKDPRSVTSLLKRNAPALRKAGWIVEDELDRNHFIIWTVRHPEKVGIRPPQSPQGPQTPQDTETESPPYAETAETADHGYEQSQDEPAFEPSLDICEAGGDISACPNFNCRLFGACAAMNGEGNEP